MGTLAWRPPFRRPLEPLERARFGPMKDQTTARKNYSSPSSSPWLDVGAPPSIDGTPAGGAAFGAAAACFARPPLVGRLAAALPGPVLAPPLAARLAGFLAAFRAGFLPAAFLAP